MEPLELVSPRTVTPGATMEFEACRVASEHSGLHRIYNRARDCRLSSLLFIGPVFQISSLYC